MTNIIGKVLGSGVAEVVNAIGDQVNKKAELQADLTKTGMNNETSVQVSQTEVNKVEAASEDNFTRRWRPFIGWICGVAMAYHFILQPMITFICATFGHSIVLPIFNMDALNTILMGMLGLGGMRSFEKIKGVR